MVRMNLNPPVPFPLVRWLATAMVAVCSVFLVGIFNGEQTRPGMEALSVEEHEILLFVIRNAQVSSLQDEIDAGKLTFGKGPGPALVAFDDNRLLLSPQFFLSDSAKQRRALQLAAQERDAAETLPSTDIAISGE